MADSVTVKVDGLAELQRALLQLPGRVQRNGVRSAVNAGAALIRAAAKAKAPIYHGDVADGHPPPGTLRKQIITKFIRELSGSTRTTYFVTVRRGKKYQKVKKGRNGGVVNLDAYYWWWVEKGTSKMPGTPYMRPAFAEQSGNAVNAIKDKLAERIEIEVAKLRSGG